jgi:LuxR family transcriptional regulator, maltose regulon positive regulatory protein
LRWQNRIDHLLPRDAFIRVDLLTNAACFTPFPALLRARLQLAQGDREAAANLLAGCYELALDAGFGYSLVTIRLLQALAATGDKTGSVGYMAEALQRAQPEEYIRSFLIEGTASILRKTNQHHLPSNPYTRRLLALLGEASAALDPTAVPAMLADPLSERQLEILRLLDQQMTNAEIAQALYLSPNTVKTHLRHIYEKLGVHDRRQAVARARVLRLI